MKVDENSNIVGVLQSINAGNHDTVCQAIRDAMPDNFFSTLLHDGRECTTDGVQFVELKTPLNGLDYLVYPQVIEIPQEGFYAEILAEDFKTCLENAGVIIATLGHPMSDLGLWVRLICIRFNVNILDSSQPLLDAVNVALQTVLELDKTGCWLVNACLHHCAQVEHSTYQEVMEAYTSWTDDEQTEFIQNTSIAMGFQIEEG